MRGRSRETIEEDEKRRAVRDNRLAARDNGEGADILRSATLIP